MNMTSTPVLASVLSIFLFCQTPAKAFVEPQTSPVLVPQTPINEPENTDPDVDSILSEFSAAYKRANTPRIAIFWNRQFGDQLSDWEQVRRRTLTTDSAVRYNLESDAWKAKGSPMNYGVRNTYSAPEWRLQSDDQDFQHLDYGGRVKSASRNYEEFKLERITRRGIGERADFDFSAGFTQAMLQSGVWLIDRNATMRLIDYENNQFSGPGDISDYQKVETGALVNYADYLAEITFSPDSNTPGGTGFMISIKEVRSGRIVVMLRSDGKPHQPTSKGKWQAMEGGYQLVTEEESEPTLHEMGEVLAWDTMSALTRAWSH